MNSHPNGLSIRVTLIGKLCYQMFVLESIEDIARKSISV